MVAPRTIKASNVAFTDNDLDRYEIGEGLRDGRLGCFEANEYTSIAVYSSRKYGNVYIYYI